MASDGERTRLEFDIPSRGIIGLRSNMLTATAGEAIMTHRLKGFEPWVGEIEMRTNGSIISGGDRHGLRLFDRQVAGPRPLLHQPDGAGLRRTGHRRAHAPERHHGQRHQGQAAHQHARFGIGRQDVDRAAEGLHARRGARIHPGRRVCRGHAALRCACAKSCCDENDRKRASK